MNTTTLQVPLSVNLKRTAKKRAQELGFSSLQEVVRVFLTQFSNHHISLNIQAQTPPEYLTPEQEVILEKTVKQAEADIKAGKAFEFENVDDFIKHAQDYARQIQS